MKTRKNFSHKRQAILDVIRSTGEHPKAEWVYEQLKEQYPNLSLATVYRNIAEFKESGEIISVGVVDGFDRLDGTPHPHPHFICNRCHAVIDVELHEPPQNFCDQISKEYAMECSQMELTFRGLCESCLNHKK